MPIDPRFIGCWLGNGTTKLYENILEELDLIQNKHIPEIYLENSFDVRLKVLGGLIDTMGSLNRNVYEIVQKSERLASDIVTLANSLGFFCRIIDKIRYATNTEKKTRHVYKRVFIFPGYHTPTIPLLIDYKKLGDDPIFNGIKFSLAKTKISHHHVWTDEMKDKFDETVAKYISKGRVPWTKIVQSEEIYKHLSPDAMRHVYADRRKAVKEA